MTPDTILTLGDFEFGRFEVPERINFGGSQAVATHRLVGGTRIVDAMGRDDAPLEWSGVFLGENALVRARHLDQLRIAGAPLILSWSEFSYTVLIQDYRADFNRFYEIPYRISCLVVQDWTSPVTAEGTESVDDAIADDMATADTLTASIADPTLTGLMGTLDAAIKSVSSFANAVTSTINSVLAPLAAVQARVNILIGSVGGVLNQVTTIGGILPNNPIAQQAASLMSQVNAMTHLPQLYNLQSVLGRMSGNLGSIGSSQQTITQAGGNLFSLAAKEYGDPTAWTTLAKANKITDPQLSGVTKLVVPPVPDNSGGVLNA
jgi:prophage DNA circulation protein